VKKRVCAAALLLAAQVGGAPLRAASVAVLYPEGVVRGFLFLKSLDGNVIANGDLTQFARGDRVTSRLVFHFKDGSVQDETAVFSQSGRFQLVSDHLVQRGPSFPDPMEVWIDAKSGQVRVRHREDGKEKTIEERMEMPSDLANGMVLTLLKNLAPGSAPTTVSMVVATPEPRLVRLVITRVADEPFSVGSQPYSATRFRIKIEIGGLAGIVAPLLGKQPKDSAVWILGGDAPGFVQSEGPFYQGGPIWRMELAAPSYPRR
jgi:hypothetical protein